jgi:hypothetical protein
MRISKITRLLRYEFINNSIELPKVPRREKWDMYSPEMRVTLGNYAVENNIRKFYHEISGCTLTFYL